MAIKANNSIQKNGIFRKVIDNLNPEKSIDKAVRSGARKAYMNKLNSEEFKDLKQNRKAAERYLSKAKIDGYKNLGDFEKAKKEANNAIFEKKAQYKSEVRDNLIDNISIGDTIKAAGTGIVDYYNPYSKNSPGKIGMATRYGATAVAGGLLANSVRELNNYKEEARTINIRERR